MTEDPASYLVTGATGFIGRRLVTRLATEGASVFCLVSRSRHQSHRLPQDRSVIPLELELEAEAASAIRRTLGDAKPEVVINLAAQGVDPKFRDPASIIAGNVGVLVRLISGLQDASPRLILHAGSWSEYASSDDGKPLSEDHPIGPVSLYGAAKASATLCGNALARQAGLPFVTLRMFNVFGPGERPNRLIPYLIQCLRSSAPADLTPGDQTRDLTYVDDVVEAIVMASRSALEPFTAYNVCSSRPTEVRWIAETVADMMTKPRSLLRFGAVPPRVDEPLSVIGDNTRFVSETGWKPRTSLEEGIHMMISESQSMNPSL